MTLEDPVEYQMEGINQVQINPQAGLTFASGLRSFLRQDPNIIMVGEIRDSETAELAIQASLTGHLVFSTLHTNSASGALPRLLDMGAEPFLLASSITLVMAQRVLRKISAEKEEYTPPPEVEKDIREVLGPLYDGWVKSKGLEGKPMKLYRGVKSKSNNDTGYEGRIGIYEVLQMNDKIARLILEHRPASEIEKQALDDGMLLMKQDGYLKVLEGITTIEEVLRVAQI
jgi:type IV pilus assembly protein PilB